MEKKRKYEKPCLQCGKCCQEEICVLGDAFLDMPPPPCPALVFKEDEYGEKKAWCGLIVETHKYAAPEECERLRKNLLEEFKFGSGCDY